MNGLLAFYHHPHKKAVLYSKGTNINNMTLEDSMPHYNHPKYNIPYHVIPFTVNFKSKKKHLYTLCHKTNIFSPVFKSIKELHNWRKMNNIQRHDNSYEFFIIHNKIGCI